MLYEKPIIEVIEFKEETLTTNLGLSGEGSGNDYDFGEQFPI